MSGKINTGCKFDHRHFSNDLVGRRPPPLPVLSNGSFFFFILNLFFIFYFLISMLSEGNTQIGSLYLWFFYVLLLWICISVLLKKPWNFVGNLWRLKLEGDCDFVQSKFWRFQPSQNDRHNKMNTWHLLKLSHLYLTKHEGTKNVNE